MNQRQNLAIISGMVPELHNELKMTEAQSIVWSAILNNGNINGFGFLRHRRVGSHTAHFLCKPLLLIVDIDPDIQVDPLHQLKTLRRTMELRNMGFYTMRFFENEVLTYPNQVKRLIRNRVEILAMKQRQRLRSV